VHAYSMKNDMSMVSGMTVLGEYAPSFLEGWSSSYTINVLA